MTKRDGTLADDKANFINQKHAAQKQRKRRIKKKAAEVKSRNTVPTMVIHGVCSTGISEKICLCIDCMLRRDKEERGLKQGRVGL